MLTLAPLTLAPRGLALLRWSGRGGTLLWTETSGTGDVDPGSVANVSADRTVSPYRPLVRRLTRDSPRQQHVLVVYVDVP